MSIEVIVAIVGSGAALLGILAGSALQHASQVSEFRQQWIYKLRKLFVKTIHDLDNYSQRVLTITIEDIRKSRDQHAQIRRDISAQILLIRLHLNKKEPAHIKLVSTLKELAELAQDNPTAYEAKKEIAVDQLQDILKTEWTRVKKGELLWAINQEPTA